MEYKSPIEIATAIGIALLCLFPDGKMFTMLDKNEVVKLINRYGFDLRKL